VVSENTEERVVQAAMRGMCPASLLMLGRAIDILRLLRSWSDQLFRIRVLFMFALHLLKQDAHSLVSTTIAATY
jgi:hypothetical protein